MQVEKKEKKKEKKRSPNQEWMSYHPVKTNRPITQLRLTSSTITQLKLTVPSPN